jgi:hypothetical protein
VGDSGATLRVIGTDHINDVVNIRPLDNPILLKTANDTIVLTECGDLPNFRGLMDNAAINRKSQHSLLPIIPICRELQYSFEVSAGGESCRFRSDSDVIEMEIVGNLPMLYPVTDNPTGLTVSHSFPSEQSACAQLCEVMSLSLEGGSTFTVSDECIIDYVCHTCQVAYSEPNGC